MSSALERAATTVAACLVDAPVAPTFSMADVNGWTKEKSYEIARAVLMAVREPDDVVIWKGHAANGHLDRHEQPLFDTCAATYAAIIDAILNEKDTTND